MKNRHTGYVFMVIGVMLLTRTFPLFSLEVPSEARGFSGGGLHLFPVGWSSEGRWGALIGRSAGSGSGTIQLVLIDAVTDELLFESEDYSWSDPNDIEAFWDVYGPSLLDVIESFDLESGRRADVREPEFTTGGVSYTFAMHPSSPAEGPYALRITSTRGDFKDVYETPADSVPGRSSLLGTLVSPFERRALAVVREEPASADEKIRYRFIGAHLTLGFSYHRSGDGGTASVPTGNLLSAVFNGQEYLVRARLAAGADPDVRDGRGYPAVLVAARLGHWTMVVDLLAAGAKPNPRDSDGRSALHHAAFAGNEEAVRALISAGADISARDGAGRTPAELAADGTIRALLR